MRTRPIFVLTFVLAVGLALGYALGRYQYQTGRFVVHSAMRPEGYVAEMYRYDTYTGRTWICHPLGADASWKEVSEDDNRYTSPVEQNPVSPRPKNPADTSRR